ncbi:MAG: hypothetical protein ACUVTU_06545 [Desulfurispora sp.]|uniref:hypothetical protein n=1 Tax=Desulfurispora sp. TaxID=3014275 RepID=UPI00404A5E2C
MRYGRGGVHLVPGQRVRLWPGDTYAKYARVEKVEAAGVTFRIIAVDAGEKVYVPGDLIRLPWSHINVRYIKS